ncbi:MAG: GDSL-like Lipase/Acylhydrolase [Rariglobus sp.]|jgi:acyl-CoA thioesterase-1|nr:GDSL-like Lipase/Acylhydrolase [Rariglobus sp.]
MTTFPSSLRRLAFALAFIPAVLFAQGYTPEKGGEKTIDPAYVKITDVNGLPRVLLIGDSISIGYTVPVRERLKGVANLHRIDINGRSTQEGIKGISTGWLGKEKWDVIHFNFGLHDLKHWNHATKQIDGKYPHYTPIDLYEKNLREIVILLKASGAKLIWASTTPLPPMSGGGRVAGDEILYNEAASRVMKEEGVITNDLYAAALSKLDEIQLPRNVHFSPAGSEFLADHVARSIRSVLKP